MRNMKRNSRAPARRTTCSALSTDDLDRLLDGGVSSRDHGLLTSPGGNVTAEASTPRGPQGAPPVGARPASLERPEQAVA